MLPMIKAKYLARACGAASFADAKSSGNRQIAIPFEVVEGEYAGENITWIGTFTNTPNSKGVTGTDRIIESLLYMGWQGDDLSELVDITDEQARQLMPEEVELVCEPDTYDGKTTLKVNWVNRPGGGRFAFKEPLQRNDVKAFAAQMRNAIRGARGANGSARPNHSGGGNSSRGNGYRSTAPHPNAPGNDDDLPF